MWRKILRAIGCLSYLGMLGVLFGLVAYVAFSQFVRSGVTPAPELFGLPEGEAAALLADQGLRCTWSDEDDRYDERVPAGHVLMQRPRAGTLVKRGSAVTVILSRGPQLIQVPSVADTALQAARVTLAAAGLELGRAVYLYTTTGSSDRVIAQQPAAGSRVEPGAPVDIFLSLESSGETFLMPDLISHSYDEVRAFFEHRGFRIGRVSYETYGGIAPGTVLAQFPQVGHPLRRGGVISLRVVAPESVAADAATPRVGPPPSAASPTAVPADPEEADRP
ncbi:MAG: PASTA domain-containing protein [bacterium]|nr:PASTA domain-containing protein [bacterium]